MCSAKVAGIGDDDTERAKTHRQNVCLQSKCLQDKGIGRLENTITNRDWQEYPPAELGQSETGTKPSARAQEPRSRTESFIVNSKLHFNEFQSRADVHLFLVS